MKYKSALAAAALVASVNAVPTKAAAQYIETDFLRQSKTCEVATRLPWGDVDMHAWVDCLGRQGTLRSKEQQKKDYATPRTPWMRALEKSLLWATEEGCESWASKQPSEPWHVDHPGVYRVNHAWNQCMQREGVFTRSASSNFKMPDFHAMAAEQRTMTIVAPSTKEEYQFFGCHTYERYEEISDAVGGVLFLDLKNLKGWGAAPPDEAAKRAWFLKSRKLIEDSADCRFWKVGERVQVKADDKSMLCLAPAGSTDRCYWTLRTAIAWE